MLFQDKFRDALETSQRVIKETFLDDNIQMNQVLTAASELYHLISSNNSLAKTVQLLEQTYRVIDLITTNIIEDDVKYIKDNGDKITEKYFRSWYRAWLGGHAVSYAEKMLKIENHNESKILKYFEACEATNETSVILRQELSPAVNKDNDNVNNIETTTESLMSTAINDNITLYDSYCNETNLDNFNTSVWKEFQNLINSNDKSEDYVDQIETWSDLLIFLKRYVGLNWLEKLKEEREHVKHPFDININVTDIFHLICNVTIETTTEPMVVTDVVPTIPQISGNLPTDVINCITIFDEVKSTYFSISLRTFEYFIPYLESYEKEYLTFIEMIYVNMSEILEVVPQHVQCIDLIKFLANYTVELKRMYHLLRNVTEVESIEEAIPVLKDLYDGYLVWRILNLNFTEYGWKVNHNDYCEWASSVMNDEGDKFPKIIDDLEATNDFKKHSYGYMERAFNSCGLIETYYITKILPTIKMINSYLEDNITKRSLAINFNKPVFIKALNDMADAAADMVSSTEDFRNEVAALRINVVKGFQDLTKFTLPFLNKVNVHELSFIKAVKALRNDSYNKTIDTFYEDLEKGIGDLLRVNYEDFVKYTLTVVDKISNAVDNLTDQVVQLQSDLNDYKATTKMDVDFYM